MNVNDAETLLAIANYRRRRSACATLRRHINGLLNDLSHAEEGAADAEAVMACLLKIHGPAVFDGRRYEWAEKLGPDAEPFDSFEVFAERGASLPVSA